MNTELWKSIVVPIDIYQGIKQISQMENRSISGQLRVIFENWCDENGYKIKNKSKD